jgi:hypothetical protein
MASLLLGAFEMLRTDGSTRVMADGTSWGEPVPIEVTVKSWLQDGAIVVTQGHDNREVNVRVRFYGDDLTALNAKEAALFAELEKPNTLTWSPGGTIPATVFVVVTSSLVQQDESFVGEVQGDPWRTYNVRLVCEAFTRSTAEVTAAAQAASGVTTTLVDNGSATTNWTGTVNGVTTAPAVTSGAVGITTGSLSGVQTISLTRTAAIATSATPYLQIDWQGSAFGSPSLAVYGDGVLLERIGQTSSPTSGFTRTWFKATTASIAALRLDSTSTDAGTYLGSYSRSLLVDNINRTDVKPTLGTARQLLRSINVSGSAPTRGSLAIEHSTNALGDVLAYFFPDGASGQNAYSPPLRQYWVSGGTTGADATLVSGTSEIFVSGFTTFTVTFDVPCRNLTAGIHPLQARMALTGGSSQVSWTATTRVNGTAIGPTLSGSRTIAVTTGGQVIYTLARLLLPTLDVDPASSSAVVRITLTGTGGAGINFVLDEAWLFNTTIGQLIQVGCGSGTAASGGPAKRVFIEPAATSIPRPTVRIGHAADRSDSFYPTDLSSWQMPVLDPPRVNVFTVCTNALDASTTLRHFPHWHTNPAS